MYWQRIVYILSLAVFEIAPAALLVTIAGGNVWLLLFGVALLGALLSRLSERWLPENSERPALLGSAAVLGVLTFIGVSGTNWDVVAAISQTNGFAYVTMLTTLYVFWRGTRLTDHDSVTVGRFFSRATLAMVVILGLGALGSALEGDLGTLAGLQLVSFFGSGLLVIALAHMTNDQGSMQHIEWRGITILAATIATVIVGALIAASLFGDFTQALLGSVLQVVAVLAAVVLAPLAIALAWVIDQLLALMGNPEFARLLAQQAQQTADTNRQIVENNQVPPLVAATLNVFCFLIPLLLLAVVMLARRRVRPAGPENELRESVLSWSGISGDLRDLFGRLRGRGGEIGLRAALARLVANDPASRIRRAYIRMLLYAEARQQARASTETPREFAPAAGRASGAAESVETLTQTYHRARYAPATATAAQADQAEQAWKQIERSEKSGA